MYVHTYTQVYVNNRQYMWKCSLTGMHSELSHVTALLRVVVGDAKGEVVCSLYKVGQLQDGLKV